MKRIRIAIIGAGAATEWAVLPALTGPDALSPPDTGAWWGRRASPTAEIQYQAPARPEIVALADSDGARVERMARAWRVRAAYSDWRVMLREVEIDALCCLAPPPLASEIVSEAARTVKWIWLDGPPATSAQDAQTLAGRLVGGICGLWCAHPLRQAAAHRAAYRLIERDSIGTVAAVALRWGLPFLSAEHEADQAVASHFEASYAALDLALHFAGRHGGGRAKIIAGEEGGATSLWLQLRHGATVTALFSGAENWSAPLPRLSICGTQGREIVCEGGRRLWLHEPRESARFLEPPGLASSISAANVVGVAEDLKSFLARAAETMGHCTDAGADSTESLNEAVEILSCLEAARLALGSGELVHWESPLAEGATAHSNSSSAHQHALSARGLSGIAASTVEPASRKSPAAAVPPAAGTLPLPL